MGEIIYHCGDFVGDSCGAGVESGRSRVPLDMGSSCNIYMVVAIYTLADLVFPLLSGLPFFVQL